MHTVLVCWDLDYLTWDDFLSSIYLPANTSFFVCLSLMEMELGGFKEREMQVNAIKIYTMKL